MYLEGWMTRSLSVLCLTACLLAVAVDRIAVVEAQGPTSVNTQGLEDGTIQSSTLEYKPDSVRWGRAVGIVEAPAAEVMFE